MLFFSEHTTEDAASSGYVASRGQKTEGTSLCARRMDVQKPIT